MTLGLLHGSCPDALILCHQATREYIGDYRQASWLKIPPLTDYIRWYESIGSAVHPTKVIGICLNTYDMTDEAARAACEKAAQETGLPATDPVRFDQALLVDAIIRARSASAKKGRLGKGSRLNAKNALPRRNRGKVLLDSYFFCVLW